MTRFRIGLILSLMIGMVSPVFSPAITPAQAQLLPSKKVHDFMIGNSPLKATELTESFDGQTHAGYYRFDSEQLPTHRFEETTTANGKSTHTVFHLLYF